eukprot:1336673-Pyramimonas_sp.AAC.1
MAPWKQGTTKEVKEKKDDSPDGGEKDVAIDADDDEDDAKSGFVERPITVFKDEKSLRDRKKLVRG